ncbi:uncharacterized protein [Elaeis guineensis]|uniref:uncharacterized protein isoform X3 n=1 Tax=Elaeis guineensis var. tenera TaxID=51953 RepID=UPI00057A8BC2
MGASRKLQGEIDRVLKKVQEGVEVFDSIWNKVYDTENANQKEKFEADLKKEIKKLQRYRDQIKTWIQSSEIKDKKVSASYEQALMDARKLIEREMERFKVCEKETKTKAFSKEGLGQQPKTDPKEKAKAETRDWLNNVVGDLESQIDNFEAEVEGLSVKKGKTRPPRLGVGSVSAANAVLGLKNSVASPSTQAPLSSTASQNTAQDQGEETASQDSNSDMAPRTPPSKSGAVESLVSLASSSVSSGTPAGPTPAATSNVSGRPLASGPTAAAILSSPLSVRGVSDNSSAAMSASIANSSSSVKEDDNMSFTGHRSSPAIHEIGSGRGISRGISSQASISAPLSLGSASGVSGSGALGSVPAVSDLAKRNMLNGEERIGSGNLLQPLASPLSNRILLHQASKTNDGTNSNDSNSVSEAALIGGRAFSPSVSGVQWRPQNAAFQSQNETGQFRGRPEIAPDQREKFLQRLQQVQQQGHTNLLGVPHLSGANHKQLSAQQQNALLQQLNSQSSISPQVGLGLGVQGPSLASVTPASQQKATPILQQSSPHPLIPTGPKDGDAGHLKVEDQNQQTLSDDMNVETATNSGFNKTVNDDDLKAPYMGTTSPSMIEGTQLPRDTDLSPGQPLQASQSSAGLGVIGRRSISDLGAIGDNLGGSAGSSGGMHDQIYNMQMLEAAFYKLPQPKDSERVKSYVPRHPAVTPASYPQTQAPIVDNPAFWERLGLDPMGTGTDTLFFAFYYQQNTYQQYLAARELKRQSWRYHRKYNTWFQRHEEPKVTNDEYEWGTYVYFDFHIADDGSQHGWCQRIKTEFTFEYNFLEDELVV